MEATERMAAAGDSTPETYAQSVLKNLPALAKEKDETVQQHLMMAIIYLVLMAPADMSGRWSVEEQEALLRGARPQRPNTRQRT